MQEIRVRLADKVLKNYTSEKGEVLQVVKKGRAKKVWDQMLERGRCTQEEYNNANVNGIDFKWPFGKMEKKEFAIIVIDDLIMDEDAKMMESRVQVDSGKLNIHGDPEMETVRRTDYKIDLENIGISGDTLTKILDPKVYVETRYDKMKARTIITKKTEEIKINAEKI